MGYQVSLLDFRANRIIWEKSHFKIAENQDTEPIDSMYINKLNFILILKD